MTRTLALLFLAACSTSSPTTEQVDLANCRANAMACLCESVHSTHGLRARFAVRSANCWICAVTADERALGERSAMCCKP